jgi:hypothetical protein
LILGVELSCDEYKTAETSQGSTHGYLPTVSCD